MSRNQEFRSSTDMSLNSYDAPTREIDLSRFFYTVWRNKWLIILVTFFFAVGSIVYAKSLPNIYMAEARLAANDDSVNGGMSNVLGQMGGLANLAGLQLGTQQLDKSSLAIEIMQSRQFISDFIESHQLKPFLFAVEEWDPLTGSIKFNPEVYDVDSELWKRETENNKPSEPTTWEAVERFRAIYSVERSGSSGLVDVKVEHLSPIVAKQWVTWLVADINDTIRERDIADASRSIEYLQQELAETTLASMQQGFYSLIEQQTHTMMLANTRPEYVFRVIDPAVVPEQRVRPSRAIIVIAGTAIGGILGAFLALLISLIRSPDWKDRNKADSERN